VTPGLPLGLLSGFPLARTLVIPFALVASPKLGLRHKSSHHSLQGSKSTNLLANSSYNTESNSVEDDDLVLLIGDKTTAINFLPHQVFIVKKLLNA
jgi:hypothetical protein